MPMRPPVHRPAGYRTLAQRRAEEDRRRGNAAKRGYDHEWRKLRDAYISANPLCECESCRAGELRVMPAQVVDHIESIAERPDLRLSWNNLRAMSKRCHDAHTAKTRGFGRATGGGDR